MVASKNTFKKKEVDKVSFHPVNNKIVSEKRSVII